MDLIERAFDGSNPFKKGDLIKFIYTNPKTKATTSYWGVCNSNERDRHCGVYYYLDMNSFLVDFQRRSYGNTTEIFFGDFTILRLSIVREKLKIRDLL